MITAAVAAGCLIRTRTTSGVHHAPGCVQHPCQLAQCDCCNCCCSAQPCIAGALAAPAAAAPPGVHHAPGCAQHPCQLGRGQAQGGIHRGSQGARHQGEASREAGAAQQHFRFCYSSRVLGHILGMRVTCASRVRAMSAILHTQCFISQRGYLYMGPATISGSMSHH